LGITYIDMRIRKRSGALFTSSSSWERARSSSSSIPMSTANGNGEKTEFLLPLVAAVMDIQRAEDKEGEGDHGTHTRPAHNWRNALQFQCSGDWNTESQALENGEESEKVDCRLNGSTRNQWENISLFTKEGTQGALLMKEETPSNAEKEITGGRNEESKLPKSGLFDMGTSWKQQKNLSVHSVKLKRSKDDIKGWKEDETRITKKLRQETYIQQEDGQKLDEKAMPNKRYNNNNNNETEGSQCRRRNGRGWRCSQRTLVGYSLCEHHLGKGRLKSINSSNNSATTVTLNNKAGTCKLKELRLIDAS